MKHWVKTLAQWTTLASVTVWSCGPAFGQAAPKPDARIRDREREQQDIRNRTQKVADQLSTIVDEFERNNLGGEEIQVLKAIQSVLGNLSETQMKQVIDLLQKAREAADPNAARQNANEAYAGQRQIIVQMHQLLLEYQRQKDLTNMAIQLAQLAEKQHKYMRNTVTMQRDVERLGVQAAGMAAALPMYQTDQESLNKEVAMVMGKIEPMAKEEGGRLVDLLAAVKKGKLQGALDSALANLKDAKLFLASASQKGARDELRQLARHLAPPKDRVAALKAALQELAQLVDQEQQVKALTQSTPTHLFNAKDKELEDRQADVLDKADMLQQDLVKLAPLAGRELKNAEDRMQEARFALAPQNQQKDPALVGEQAALDSMEKTRRLIEDELRSAEDNKLAKVDPATKIQELQKEVKDLIKQEEKLKTDTAAGENKPGELKAAAPKQKDVQAKTEEIQKQVAPLAPKANEPMAEAVKQMDKAQQTLANQQPRNPAEAQQAAINQLQKADQALGQELQKTDQAKNDLKAVEDALALIAKLIIDQERIERDTATNAGASSRPVAAATSQPTPAPKQLAKDEQDLAGRTQQVRESLKAPEEDAAPPLESAQKHMDGAQGKLDQTDPAGAQPQEREALADLQKAKDALEKKAEALKQDLGEQKKPEAMAAVEQKAQEIQKDIAKAMENAPPPTEMQKLEQQQQQIAQNLQQMQQQHPENQPLNKAAQAAQQAAQQLAQNNPQQAVQQMQQAQRAMQEAQQNPPQNPQDNQPKDPADPQQGEPKQGEPKQGEPMQGEPKQGDPKQGEPKQGEPHQGEPHQGEPHQGEPHQGEPHQGEPHAGEPHAGEPHAGEPHAGEPHAGEPHAGEPHAGEPHAGEPHAGEPHAGEPHAGQPHAGSEPGAPHPGSEPGLPQLAQQQAQVMQQAQKLAAQPPQAPTPAQQQMANALNQAAQKMDQLAAQPNEQLHQQIDDALQQAQQALSQAAAEAANNQVPQESAAQAQQALAQAQAAMEMAQAMPENGPPHEGNHPGSHPGKSNKPSNKPANEMAVKPPGDSHRQDINSNVTNGGPRGDVKDAGAFIGLPPRDRAAIEQSMKEKYPEAYGPQVQQYMKNLADEGK